MTISLVIVTAALADAATTPLSSGKQAHGDRAYLLRNVILPQAIASGEFAEILVVGEFEAGEGYRWLDVPSVEHSSIHDGLRKRHLGTLAATGDWIAIQNDDHVFDPQAMARARNYMSYTLSDVVSPARWTRLRHADGERLNGGEPGGRWAGAGHINGHGCVFRRAVLDECPWDTLPKVFSYDMAMTKRITDAGFHVVWAEDVRLWDIEQGATPWV